MDLAGLVVFSTALFIAAASPGPGIAAIVARVLGRGTRGAVAFIVGVAIGRRGLAHLRDRRAGRPGPGVPRCLPRHQVCRRGLSALSRVQALDRAGRSPGTLDAQDTAATHPARLFLGGLAITMGNPKIMVFYLALLPTLLDLTRITVWAMPSSSLQPRGAGAVFLRAISLLAARARRLFTSPGVGGLNRATGAMMAGRRRQSRPLGTCGTIGLGFRAGCAHARVEIRWPFH